jgi:hypothetical protein
MSKDIGPGDVVVCVDAKPNRDDPLAGLLSEGRAYRAAIVGARDTDGAPSVGFRDIRPSEPGKVWAFSLYRFRKLNDGEGDSELIARIKNCSPVREGVPS